MKLYEFQGKDIFRSYGIKTPRGTLIKKGEELPDLNVPVVVKAQVLTGGRGKAGGIAICQSDSQVQKALAALWSMEFKGEPVRAALVEEKVEILRELYLSVTFEGTQASPVLVASGAGGVEIERVAEEKPNEIIKTFFHPLVGPLDYQIRYIARKLGIDDFRAFKGLVEKIYRIFKEYQASLVEINPLVLTSEGLVALDAKMLLDTKAYYKKQEVFKELQRVQTGLGADEQLDSDDTITYVPLDGSIALISDGAGTGMLTLDLLKDAGGEAANFCEMGGITSPDVIFKAMETVLGKPGVKSLLIVMIGGFNRMDEMAEGIVRFKKVKGLNIPVVVRMCGTLEEEGKSIMKAAGIPTYDSLYEAVSQVIALTEVK